jgi:nucleoside 2-deoxyribosyltransferase
MKKVFFCWQDDVPTNTRLIREALKRVLKTIDGYEIDEATRDVLGAINIADKALEKIRDCDIFIADLTVINKGSKFRITPNPNVMLELGYALSEKGESRLILISRERRPRKSEITV